MVLAAVDELPAWSPPRPEYIVHRVRRGETLSSIAVRYRTSVERIRDANNLRSTRFIRAGQRLRIPLTSAS
jgi:membrane-bound lytic murein transglycosylase D